MTPWNTAIHPRVAELRNVIAERRRAREEPEPADDGSEVVLTTDKSKTYYYTGAEASEFSNYLSAPA